MGMRVSSDGAGSTVGRGGIERLVRCRIGSLLGRDGLESLVEQRGLGTGWVGAILGASKDGARWRHC